MNPSKGSILRIGPSRPIAALIAAASVATALFAYFADLPTGRILLGCAAIVLATIAAADVVFWPRLTASATGVAVFAPTVRARLRWDEVTSIRVDERTHRGLATRALEIETTDQLIVLSKRSLGGDPFIACAELLELRANR